MTTNNPPGSRVYRRIFPGRPDQISEVRRFIRAHLASHQRTADVALVATELTTNAWEHTHSHRGTFTVCAELRPDDTIRLEVEDNGGPLTFGEYKRDDEGGRGLGIVDALTSKWGVAGDSTGRTVWAEFR
jgi:anti-sigma regulatory factor (Ser/Thr protein kinase)